MMGIKMPILQSSYRRLFKTAIMKGKPIYILSRFFAVLGGMSLGYGVSAILMTFWFVLLEAVVSDEDIRKVIFSVGFVALLIAGLLLGGRIGYRSQAWTKRYLSIMGLLLPILTAGTVFYMHKSEAFKKPDRSAAAATRALDSIRLAQQAYFDANHHYAADLEALKWKADGPSPFTYSTDDTGASKVACTEDNNETIAPTKIYKFCETMTIDGILRPCR